MVGGWRGRDMRARETVLVCAGAGVAAVVFDTSTPRLSSSEPSPSSNGRALSGLFLLSVEGKCGRVAAWPHIQHTWHMHD